jgi:hypothetical protein
LTEDELNRFGHSVADALTLIVGLFSEATARVPTAVHLAAAYRARQQTRPDPVRDNLLIDAVRLAVLKAQNAAPADPVVQDLVATFLPGQRRQ